MVIKNLVGGQLTWAIAHQASEERKLILRAMST